MLDSIRKRKDNFIFSLLILLVVAVMAFYGIGQMDKPRDRSAYEAVAFVNGEPVTAMEFSREMQAWENRFRSVMGGKPLDPKLLQMFQIPNKALSAAIQAKLLSQQARKMGFVISNYELADYIRNIPSFQKDGKFDADAYKKIPNRGIEEQWMREALEATKLQSYLAGRLKPTPEELRRMHQLKETKIDLEYAKINFPALVNARPSNTEVEQFLKTGAESEFQQYYDSHSKDFTEKAAVELRQIRVGLPIGANEKQKADAKKKIDEIAKEATLQNFDAVAKSKSDDEYAKRGGEVGWVTRGTLDLALEKGIDNAPDNRLSVPIETKLGYYIIHVKQRRAEQAKPLADVKKAVAEKLLIEKTQKQFETAKKTEWEKSLSAEHSIVPELKRLKIDVKKTGLFAVSQPNVPGIGNAENVLDAIFDLSLKHPVSKKLIYYSDNYYYIKLLSVQPAKETDLSKNSKALQDEAHMASTQAVLGRWLEMLEKNATIKREMALGEQEEV